MRIKADFRTMSNTAISARRSSAISCRCWVSAERSLRSEFQIDARMPMNTPSTTITRSTTMVVQCRCFTRSATWRGFESAAARLVCGGSCGDWIGSSEVLMAWLCPRVADTRWFAAVANAAPLPRSWRRPASCRACQKDGARQACPAANLGLRIYRLAPAIFPDLKAAGRGRPVGVASADRDRPTTARRSSKEAAPKRSVMKDNNGSSTDGQHRADVPGSASPGKRPLSNVYRSAKQRRVRDGR